MGASRTYIQGLGAGHGMSRVCLALAVLWQLGCGSTGHSPSGGGAAESRASGASSTASSSSSNTNGVTTTGATSSASGSSGGASNVSTSSGTAGSSVGGQAAGGASSTDSSVGGSAGALSNSGTGGTNADIGNCDDCDACLEGGEFVECDAERIGGCVCETPDMDDKDDYETLSSCPLESPCPPARYDVGGPLGSWTDRDCLLTALRDRTAGRYDFLHHASDGSYTNTDWLLVVTPTGDVLRSAFTDTGVVSSTTASRYYQTFESCVLSESAFFDACLADAEACSAIGEWFVACTPAPAECPE